MFCEHTLSLKLKTVFYFRAHLLFRSYMRYPGSLVDYLFGEPRDMETRSDEHKATAHISEVFAAALLLPDNIRQCVVNRSSNMSANSRQQ